MTEQSGPSASALSVDRGPYDAFMEIVRNRITTRAFQSAYAVPREHFELIVDAARHAPSGANAQPWHFIVVTDPERKLRISEHFVAEQARRARLGMKFPTPNYHGIATAPGLIVVATDFRWIRAFPVLREDDPDSEVNRPYYENAERILLQSVAAATMSAHLAATALGYNVWWVTAIGQRDAQAAIKPLLEVPEEISIIDIMCFGPPAKPVYKRWKKDLGEIMSWDRFDRSRHLSDDELEDWIKNRRHRVMYRSEENVD
ncbi:MAG TPA: nitroreductase family protein [Solirubrobacteraceae bacterium]|nr:nitroreductase family protein [Solirubrobacteraceae bacterium]